MLSLTDRRRAERFAALLDAPARAVPAELAALLALSRALQRAPVDGDVDALGRARMRGRLVAMATVLPANVHPADGAPTARQTQRRAPLSRRSAVVSGALAAALALTAVASASTTALPGNPLYALKQAAESAQLTMAGGDVERGRLNLRFARHRMDEAARVHSNQTRLVDTLHRMDAETRGASRLLTSVAIADQDRAPLDSVDSFVRTQRIDLGALLPMLTSTRARERAVDSLVLVEQLRSRSIALRATLLCAVGTRSDELGPVPAPCDRAPGSAGGAKTGPGPGGTSSTPSGLGPTLSGQGTPPPGTTGGNPTPTLPTTTLPTTTLPGTTLPGGGDPPVPEQDTVISGVTGAVDSVTMVVGQVLGSVGGTLGTTITSPVPLPTLPPALPGAGG